MKKTKARVATRTKGNKKKHLTKKVRIQIEVLLKRGDNIRSIATTLGIGKTTVSDEVSRNGGREHYNAEKAHRRAYWKQYRKKRHCNKVAMHGELSRYVERRLEAGWSPETISTRIKRHNGVARASAKSIRKYIKRRAGLSRFLFFKRVHKKSGKKRGSQSSIGARNFIDLRPTTAETDYGHWEGDFIVSKQSKWVLLVLVEKQSRFTVVRRLPNRNNDAVNDAIVSALEGYNVKSLTIDNDIAFTRWRALEQRLDSNIFFTHPYHSWEKGLVENMNRWIRQFVPKRIDVGSITDEECQSIQDWLNHMPRLCLSGETSYERMMILQRGVILSSVEVSLPRVSVFGG